MKRLLLLFSVVVCFSLYSCDKNEMKNEPVKSEVDNTQTSDLKKISEYHSKGLDHIYDELLKERKTRTVNDKDWDSELLKKRIYNLSIEFVRNVANVNIDDNSKTRSLTEIDNIELSSDAQYILEDYISYLINSKKREDVELYIQNTKENEKFKSLTEKEQNQLIFSMYIGIDSVSYWSNPDNWDKWSCLKNSKDCNKTRSMAGPSANYWMNSEQMSNSHFLKCIKNDIYGSVTSLLGGFTPWSWCSSAIAGSVGAFIL